MGQARVIVEQKFEIRVNIEEIEEKLVEKLEKEINNLKHISDACAYYEMDSDEIIITGSYQTPATIYSSEQTREEPASWEIEYDNDADEHYLEKIVREEVKNMDLDMAVEIQDYEILGE